MKKRKTHLPVMPGMCKTCPFRKTGWVQVRDLLEERALNVATPICHCTGPGAIGKRIRRNSHACRGARNLQLELFHALGLLKEPTDECWAAKVKELKI